MDDDEVQGMQQPPASTSDGRNNDSNDNDDGEDSEDEVMDMVVKSQDTLIQERHNRALAAGNVHSLLTSTATGTSIRSTFQSISSTVTAMRGGTSRLQERKVEIRDVSLMKEFTATRMILDADHDKITKAPGEEVDGRRVKIAVQPFAQGGLRNVYRMKQYGVQRQVAKESRHDISDRDRLRFHFEAAKCHARAKVYADAFNERVKRLKLSVSRIQFLPAEVYRLRDSSFPRGFRYLAVENEMRGKDHQYRKWNGNNGYVNPSNSDPCLVAQAFSHFSFENGSHNEMVVDIQGDCYQYTDPQLHSKDKHFGRADRGESGFKDFFKTHRCNHICKGLGLKEEALSSL